MVNSWISHVKNYAATHNISYPVAMIQAKASYKKMSGGMTLKDYGLGEWDKMKQKKRLTQGAENIATQAGFGMFNYTPQPEDDKYRVRPAVMPNKHNLKYFTQEELDKYGYKGEGVKKRGRPRKMKGGQTIKDWGIEQWDKIPDAYKPGLESLGQAAFHQAGFGIKKRGRPRKMKGGQTIKDWGIEQWDKVPDAYKPGLESLGQAAFHQAGFGIKKRGRPRKMKGGDIFSDIGNAFDPNKNGVAEAFRPGGPAEDFGKQVASELIHKGIPITVSTLAAAATAAQPGNPLSPMLAGYAGEKAGEALAGYVGEQTGYGIVSDAMAYAKRKGKAAAQKVAQHLQKLAKQKANDMLDEGLERSSAYIEGLGLKKRRGRKKKGGALMAAGY